MAKKNIQKSTAAGGSGSPSKRIRESLSFSTVPPDTMASSLHQTLLAELADIERQQQNLDLSHSDQQLLDQAWEDVTNRLDELETIYEENVDWRDAAVYLDSEEEDSRPPTPVPIRPSITMESGINRRGEIVARLPGEAWVPVPTLSSTWSPPPPIEIPMIGSLQTTAPPPPRPAGVRICNCDSDGQCAYCEEEELERWNNMVDDRPGCERCAGCVYCREGGGYDGADEV
jgi:hypothetical protein